MCVCTNRMQQENKIRARMRRRKVILGGLLFTICDDPMPRLGRREKINNDEKYQRLYTHTQFHSVCHTPPLTYKHTHTLVEEAKLYTNGRRTARHLNGRCLLSKLWFTWQNQVGCVSNTESDPTTRAHALKFPKKVWKFKFAFWMWAKCVEMKLFQKIELHEMTNIPSEPTESGSYAYSEVIVSDLNPLQIIRHFWRLRKLGTKRSLTKQSKIGHLFSLSECIRFVYF